MNLGGFERELGLLVQLSDAEVRWNIGRVFHDERLSVSDTHTHPD